MGKSIEDLAQYRLKDDTILCAINWWPRGQVNRRRWYKINEDLSNLRLKKKFYLWRKFNFVCRLIAKVEH